MTNIWFFVLIKLSNFTFSLSIIFIGDIYKKFIIQTLTFNVNIYIL